VADNHANTQGSGLWFDGTSARPAAGRLLHTTIADNHGSGQGVYVGDYTTLAFTNTIVSGHGSVGITVTAGSTVTLAATLWHGNGSHTFGDGAIISSTNVYSAPGFVDPSTWDYHLNADSAAIDRGVDSDIAMDIDGEARPAGGYDLGADEYHSFFGVLLTPNRNGSAAPGTVITYTHTLTNSGNYTDTFTLGYSSSQGWASAAPPSVTLAAGGTQQVVVTVSVPAGAAVGVVESTVITATSQTASSIFDTVTDTTTVTRVAGVQLAPDRVGSAAPGAVITYTHTLTNSGNYTDAFALSYSSSQGWASAAPLSVTLAAGGTQQVVATVSAPDGAAVGVVESTVITAASQAAPSIFDTVTDTTTVTQVAGVQLAPDRVGNAAPGAVITYTHTLTNSGNYTDTFTLGYSSSQGWALVVPPSVTLAAGGTQQVVVTVSVPAGAAVGVVESTVLHPQNWTHY